MLGRDVGNSTGNVARATLHSGVHTSTLNSLGRHLRLLRHDVHALVLVGGDADRLVVHETRVLVAVQRSEVARLAREHAAEALLLHEVAVRLADKEPLEILRRHYGEVGGRSGAHSSFAELQIARDPGATWLIARWPMLFLMASEPSVERNARGIPAAPFVVGAPSSFRKMS